MTRHRSGYVQVDVSEIIDEIEDDVLLEEIHARKLLVGTTGDAATDVDIVREAYAELLRGRPGEALSILDRLLNPKWKSVDACAKDLAQRRHLFWETMTIIDS